MNSNGPKQDPWGTPEFISSSLDLKLFTLVDCILLLKKLFIRRSGSPRMPYFSNFFSKTQWSTVLNAFAKSKKILQVTRFLSKALEMWSTVSKTTRSVELFSLKPNCLLLITLFF